MEKPSKETLDLLGLKQDQEQSMMSEGTPASVEDMITRQPTTEKIATIKPEALPKEKSYEENLLDQIRGIRESSKEDVAAARADDRKREMYANLAKALGSIGAAEIQRKAGVKAGLQPFQSAKVESTAKDVMADKRADIQSLLDEYKLKKAAKDKIYQTRSTILKLGDDEKPKVIFEDPYMKDSLDIKSKSLGLRSKKFDEKKIQKFQDDAEKAMKSMRSTDSWKDSEKTLSTIKDLDLLVEDAFREGGQSLSMLGPKLAKGLAGETGALTEKDVTMYIKDPTLVGGVMSTFKRWKDGKLKLQDYKNVKRLLEVSKRSARKKMNHAIDRQAIALSRVEGISFEDAVYLLDTEYKRSAKEKVERKEQDDSDVVKIGDKKYQVGSIIVAKGKRYRIKNSKGHLEELK